MAISPTQTTPPASALINLPPELSPDSVDTLTVLSALLSRLHLPAGSNPATSIAGSPAAPSPSPSQAASNTNTIALKDIPKATDQVKHKLQKARKQVKTLPDMDRLCTEQEEEMRELEGRIAKQREVLEVLRDLGLEMKRERELTEKEEIGDAMET